jgi:hypothetical protein
MIRGARPHALAEDKEATIGEPKRVIGDPLRSRTTRRQATEVAIAVNAPVGYEKLERCITRPIRLDLKRASCEAH